MEDYLVHHGIKGMKWGVRRYRNYDGSYTKAGLERYRRSLDVYDKRKKEYDAIKADKSKSNYEKRYAKARMQEAKRLNNKDYKHLALDKKADEGKILYAKGVRIRDNKKFTNAVVGSSGIAINTAHFLRMTGTIDSKSAKIVTYAALGAAAFAAAKNVFDEIPNSKLRAYYSHTSNY